MINGDINEFMDKLWGGEELIYTYNGKKYFSQGYNEKKVVVNITLLGKVSYTGT